MGLSLSYRYNNAATIAAKHLKSMVGQQFTHINPLYVHKITGLDHTRFLLLFFPLFFRFCAVHYIKLPISSAFECTLIYHIVSYRAFPAMAEYICNILRFTKQTTDVCTSYAAYR